MFAVTRSYNRSWLPCLCRHGRPLADRSGPTQVLQLHQAFIGSSCPLCGDSTMALTGRVCLTIVSSNASPAAAAMPHHRQQTCLTTNWESSSSSPQAAARPAG